MSLERMWTDLAESGSRPVHRRLEDSQLDIYVGLGVDDRRYLLLIVPAESSSVDKRRFKAISLLVRKREDGRFALEIALRRPDLGKIFGHLCEDLVRNLVETAEPDTAAEVVSNRIAHWEKLLSAGKPDLLTLDEIRGLLAELLCLQRLMLTRAASEAVESWKGPLGAAQDFVLADIAVEVKAVTSDLVAWIASKEQLDSQLPLLLRATQLDGPLTGGHLSLTSVVDDMRQHLKMTPDVAADFEARLLLAGYRDDSYYDRLRFSHAGDFLFQVREGFPRLTRNTLDAAIGRVSYELQLRFCAEFRCAFEDL